MRDVRRSCRNSIQSAPDPALVVEVGLHKVVEFCPRGEETVRPGRRHLKHVIAQVDVHNAEGRSFLGVRARRCVGILLDGGTVPARASRLTNALAAAIEGRRDAAEEEQDRSQVLLADPFDEESPKGMQCPAHAHAGEENEAGECQSIEKIADNIDHG